MLRVRIGVIVCSLSAIISDSLAGTISIDTVAVSGASKTLTLQRHTVRLTGLIEKGDAEKLRSVLARLRLAETAVSFAPLPAIELSSRGGGLLEGHAPPSRSARPTADGCCSTITATGSPPDRP